MDFEKFDTISNVIKILKIQETSLILTIFELIFKVWRRDNLDFARIKWSVLRAELFNSF